MKKIEIFSSQPEYDEDGKYFEMSFPDMPDIEFLHEHIRAVPWLSNEAFIHYAPMFIDYLSNNPDDQSMLVHYMEVVFDRVIKPGADDGIVKMYERFLSVRAGMT